MKSNRLTTAWTLLLLVVFGVSGSTAASDVCQLPEGATARPGGAEPVEVKIGVFLLDLVHIQDVDQGFIADVFVRATWRDPRLAEPGRPPCILDTSQVWTPMPEVLNQRGLERKWADVVEIDADGNLLQRQRYYGELSFLADLTDFPFDSQRLTVSILLGERSDDVVIVADDEITGRADNLSIPNWEIGAETAKNDSYHIAVANRNIPMLTVEYPAHRRSEYYIFQTLVPLTLIIAMPWAVFWIHPRHVPPRLGLAATAMLTLIAFRLALGSQLPPVAYLTRIDRFVLVATAIVFAALVESVATAALADKDHLEPALKINRWSRIVFPASYLLAIYYAFG